MNDKSMFLHKVALCLVTLLLIVRSVEPQGRNTIYRTYGNSEIRRTKKTENGTTTKWNTIKGKKNKSGKTNKKHGKKGKTNKKNGPSDVIHPTMSPTPALELAGDWTVLGDYIYGEVDEAYSGDSVSISNDGSILLIGSYGASEARVFSLVDTAWFMKGEILKGAPGTDFGRSTSISNDGMIIVVSQYAHPNLVVGAVKTFVWSGTSWNTYSEDVIGDAAGDGFGIEVDLSGDAKTLIVCARQYARIYQWTDSGWITQHTIREEALGDTLGCATSITEDGNKVAVGGKNVRTFQRIGSEWSKTGQIDADPNGDSTFGSAVDISSQGGNILVISEFQGSSVSKVRSGLVYIYEWDGSEWQKKGDTIEGEKAEDNFGYSVALSGNGMTLAVGVFAFPISPSVRVFRWNGFEWVVKGSPVEGEQNTAVDISGDGNVLVVGLSYIDEDNEKGKTRTYRWV